MAINWSNHVPRDPRGQAFPLKRTPANGKLVAAITCEHLTGCDTHFYGGKTMPCERPDCEACNNGMPFRWHGYISAIQATTRLHFIFEFTAQAADYFDQYDKAHGTLRGCRFEAWRLHHRPNGRVIIQCKPLDQQEHQLPKPPNVPNCMAIIWNLPTDQISNAQQRNGRPAMTNTHQTLSRFEGIQLPPKRILEP